MCVRHWPLPILSAQSTHERQHDAIRWVMSRDVNSFVIVFYFAKLVPRFALTPICTVYNSRRAAHLRSLLLLLTARQHAVLRNRRQQCSHASSRALEQHDFLLLLVILLLRLKQLCLGLLSLFGVL